MTNSALDSYNLNPDGFCSTFCCRKLVIFPFQNPRQAPTLSRRHVARHPPQQAAQTPRIKGHTRHKADSDDDSSSLERLSISLHGVAIQDDHIPDDYVLPEEYRPITGHDEFLAHSEEEDHIPFVDMSNFDADGNSSDSDAATKKTIETMVAACHNWGYFLLVNHGVELHLMEKVEEQAYNFFLKLPAEENAKHSSSSLREKVKRWSEGVVIKASSVDEYDTKLSPPQNDKQFSTTVREYDAVMKKLATRIVGLLVEGLGVKQSHFANYMEGVEASLRWNYQPPCPQPDKALGLTPHTDPYLITLQHDSGIGGLQIQRHGKWIGVGPRADALIVNVGDVFEILTNGKFKSPLHRTVVNKVEGRLSVAHCLSPAGHVPLIPPPELLRSGANLYKTWTYEEYLGAKKGHPADSLDFIKVATHV